MFHRGKIKSKDKNVLLLHQLENAFLNCFSSAEQYIKLKIPNVQIAIKRFGKVICKDKDEFVDF